jgi:hypothetical protein
MQFSLNIHCEFSLFLYMFFLVCGGGAGGGVISACWSSVLWMFGRRPRWRPLLMVFVSLVSIPFQFFLRFYTCSHYCSHSNCFFLISMLFLLFYVEIEPAFDGGVVCLALPLSDCYYNLLASALDTSTEMIFSNDTFFYQRWFN